MINPNNTVNPTNTMLTTGVRQQIIDQTKLYTLLKNLIELLEREFGTTDMYRTVHSIQKNQYGLSIQTYRILLYFSLYYFLEDQKKTHWFTATPYRAVQKRKKQDIEFGNRLDKQLNKAATFLKKKSDTTVLYQNNFRVFYSQTRNQQEIDTHIQNIIQNIQRIKTNEDASESDIEFLNNGNFGRLYCLHVKDTTETTTLYAVKFSTNDISRQEIEFQRGLKHENILTVVSSVAEEKYFFTVLDYMDGGDLKQAIKKKMLTRK